MSLEINSVSKSFGPKDAKRVLNELSFRVPTGHFCSLLGPSGCGKTSLLRIIAGLDHPTHGKVSVDGQRLVDSTQRVFVEPEHRNIALVFQNYALWPHMSVFENIAFSLRIRKVPKAQIHSAVKEVLETVHLEGLEERRPEALSGGQQQRVALARALIQKPRLLLLDEPLSNLDASLRENMRLELRKLQQSLGITAVIVTHDWADARALSDTVVVLREGRVEQQGSPRELSENPCSDFVRRLTGSGA